MPVHLAGNSKIQEYNLADILGVKPSRLFGLLLKKPGDKVKEGDLIAQKKGFRKRFFVSPTDGEIVSISDAGALTISSDSEPALSVPLSRKAPVAGKGLPVELGFGGKGGGQLLFFDGEVGVFDIDEGVEGKVIAFPAVMSLGLWYKALSLGVKGVICAGLPNDLASRLKKEIPELDGKTDEEEVPLLVLEENEEAWKTLKGYQDKRVDMDGKEKLLLLIESK